MCETRDEADKRNERAEAERDELQAKLAGLAKAALPLKKGVIPGGWTTEDWDRFQKALSSIPETGRVLVDEIFIKSLEIQIKHLDEGLDASNECNKSLQADNEALRGFIRCRNCNRWLNGFETDDPCPWIKSRDPTQCGLSDIKAALEAKP